MKSNNKTGVIFGTFAPMHEGHLDLISKAKSECDKGCIVIVSGYDGDRGEPILPVDVRYNCVKEYFALDEKVKVYSINETQLGIKSYPTGWKQFMEEVKRLCNKPIEELVFYVSEQEYTDYLKENGYEVVKMDRTLNPISATMIRKEPLKHLDKVATTFRKYMQILEDMNDLNKFLEEEFEI